MSAPTRYLNTDLDLVSDAESTELSEHFASRDWIVLHSGVHEDGLWRASFEVGESHERADLTLSNMLDGIEALDGALHSLWMACSERVFSVGLDCGGEPRLFEMNLPNELLRRMAAVSCSLSLSLYSANGGWPPE